MVEARPEEVGLSSPSLDRLRPLLASWVSSEKMPMAEVLVARRGKVAWRGGVGEQTAGKPLSEDTIYRIYSMTKPVTSAAIMILVEEGRLQLGMPVHLFLGKSWHRKRMRVLVGGTKVAAALFRIHGIYM